MKLNEFWNYYSIQINRILLIIDELKKNKNIFNG